MNDRPTQDTLFQSSGQPETRALDPASVPLAERCRPAQLEDIAGQDAILGGDRPLRKAIEQGRAPSMVLWGPPGSGKTTLARLVAHTTDTRFCQLSATGSGIKDLKKIIEEAESVRRQTGKNTILFIDEIHRWNKAQQDALLPHVESGLIVLIGATTENPSFEVNGALLSRVTVYTLSMLEPEHLLTILRNGIDVFQKEGRPVEADEESLNAIASVSHGDARVALNALEQVVHYLEADGQPLKLTLEFTSHVLQEKRVLYDKSGEEHFNIISALHKSMRGSDPQATLYWLARMLEAGEDPLYVVRRIIRFAAEDIGLADPNALLLAVAARDTYHFLGSPEGELAIAEAAVYMATAPKSNAIYTAYGKAQQAVKEHGYLPTPLHIRNAPTSLMKNLGYGKDYKYAHDYENAFAAQDYLPDKLKGKRFYEPTDRGREKQILERMEHWQKLAEAQQKDGEETTDSA